MPTLQDKYAELVSAAKASGTSNLAVRAQDNVLYIDGEVPSGEVKDKLWNIYDKIDPDFRSADLVLNLNVSAAAPGTKLKVTTQTSNLNIRKGPGTDQPIIGKPLADFVAPRESGRIDYVGGFAVTAGHGVEQLAVEFKAVHDDYSAIMAQALGDRLAEALAEFMHKKQRDFSGFGRSENLSMSDMIREKYRGIRPAPGYPACPDHTEKPPLFSLLDALGPRGVEDLIEAAEPAEPGLRLFTWTTEEDP